MWAFDFNRISTSGDEDLDSTVDSVCQGEVIYAGNGYGNYVVIRGKDGPSGLYYDYAVLYAHLNTINQDLLNDFIASGGYHYYVDIGDNIGKMGESGWSSSYNSVHLHIAFYKNITEDTTVDDGGIYYNFCNELSKGEQIKYFPVNRLINPLEQSDKYTNKQIDIKEIMRMQLEDGIQVDDNFLRKIGYE